MAVSRLTLCDHNRRASSRLFYLRRPFAAVSMLDGGVEFEVNRGKEDRPASGLRLRSGRQLRSRGDLPALLEARPRPDSDDEEEDCGAAEHWAPRISRRGVPRRGRFSGERADSPPIQSKLIAKPAPLKMAPLALQRSGVSDLLFNMDFNKNNDSSSLNPPSALASVPATAEPAARSNSDEPLP